MCVRFAEGIGERKKIDVIAGRRVLAAKQSFFLQGDCFARNDMLIKG